MTLLPIIERELRAGARQVATYNLRLAGAAVVLVATVLFWFRQGFEPNAGGRLFGELHGTLFLAIWVLVPLLTADCLSRERREGTLGLLFLTRLRATDIVVSKGLAHGLRALSLLLAVGPVLSIAFLMGGVSWSQVLLSVLVNLSAIAWALAAGLLASALSTRRAQALLRAGILAIISLMILGTVAGWVLLPSARTGMSIGRTVARWQVSADYMLLEGMSFIRNPGAAGMPYARFSPSGNILVSGPPYQVWNAASGRPYRVWSVAGGKGPRTTTGNQALWSAGEVAFISLVGLAAAVWLSGVWTRRVWQEEPPSRQAIWWQATFCTPVLWLSFFRRWMRHKLERNPVGWLEQRTWSGRVVTWAWFSIVISIYSSVLANPNLFRSPEGIGEILAWLVAGSMALSAAGSFRRERESGVLELLLVSPLGERNIVMGRLCGLWSQFLPAFCMLLGLWCYVASFSSTRQSDYSAPAVLFFVSTFMCLPVIGLYFSLRCRNFITAFVATLAVGLAGPVWWLDLLGVGWWFLSPNLINMQTTTWSQALIAQGIVAIACWRALNDRLKRRAFPLERAQM